MLQKFRKQEKTGIIQTTDMYLDSDQSTIRKWN